ncbi:MAG: GNAT family N-acetyltransferase [Actinomycetia bacterium]|nr:GNAT family N-acetyltransferase [Actinomycetes bacterium]
MSTRIDAATPARLTELADVAARTFPLACPPSVAPQDVAAFIEENLSPGRFGDYLDDPDRAVLTATEGERIIGYAMVVRGLPGDDAVGDGDDDDGDGALAVMTRPAVQLSKLYVLPEAHGAGVSAALISAALQQAGNLGGACVWLGVNQHNQRAQRFYTKHGFTVTGTRTLRLGCHREHDYVMVRPA